MYLTLSRQVCRGLRLVRKRVIYRQHSLSFFSTPHRAGFFFFLYERANNGRGLGSQQSL